VPAEAAELPLAGQSWAVISDGAPADQLVAELAEAGVSAASHYDLPSLAELGTVAPVVLAPIRIPVDAAEDVPGAIRELLAELLDLIQAWLGDERFAGSRLTVLSPGSGAGPSGQLSAVLGSAVWGLVRSAAAEHPGRFALLDGERPNWSRAAAAVATGDWQLAVRDGQLLVPRLASVPAAEPNLPELSDGTVLITGGTSGLGALAAERLVQAHGVQRLLLLSRRGPATPGADELVDRLRGLGAEVTVLACDVANRRALAKALDSAPRLVGVVHAAGVLDDAPVDRLSAAQLEPVLAAKADAAWHLHELTREHELAFFVEYSSVAGSLGTAGQSNYAAANAFLDGLAGYRRGQGLPATSIGWGLWRQATGLTGRLSEADLTRLARAGLAPLDTETGLALFDQAISSPVPVLLAATWDRSALQARSDAGTLPPMLKSLVKVSRPPRPTERGEHRPTETTLTHKLASLPQPEARQLLVDLVRTQVATVLGHADPGAIESGQGFSDLGFDSLTVVDLRNRLDQATGLRLPASLAFDYPTPAALAEHLLATLAPAPLAPEDSLRIALEDVQQQLIADGTDRAKVVALLQRTLARLESGGVSAGLHETISAATDDEIFALIDNQFSS
jgi:acyl carrier protein